MTPWLLFGAGGKGVRCQNLELALAEQRPVVAVIRHADTATRNWRNKAYRFLQATPVMPTRSRGCLPRSWPGCAYHLNNGRSSGLSGAQNSD